MPKKQTDIIVSGAGAAGLTLALLLAKAGLRVSVIDPADKKALSHNAPSGRTVALMNGSLNILRAAGVWPTLQEISAPLRTMRLKDRDVQEDFDAADIGEEQFGFNVPNNALRTALFKAAQKEKIDFYLGTKLHDYEVQGTSIFARLENKKTLQAPLLIGADGRNSVVRACAGIQTEKKAYDQSAITCLINHSRSHENISTEFHRPAGPLALVPLPGNQSSVVWVETPEKAEALLRLKKQEFEAALQEETQDILGAITVEVGPESWPLSMIKAKSLTAERVALIAEAAHVMSPITAQGLNLSLRDVATLAETIVDAARLGQDIGGKATLNHYAKRRRMDIETRVFGVDRMNRLVSNDIEAIRGLRKAGLKTLSSLPPLKTTAMRIGLAPALDQGRLVRGEAL